MSVPLRATSPRRDIREAKVFQSSEATKIPVETPIHPDAAKNSSASAQPRGPAYAQAVYERRLGRSRSPNANGVMSPQEGHYMPQQQGGNAGGGQYYTPAPTSAAVNQYTPSRGTYYNNNTTAYNNNNFSTAGTTGGAYTPVQSIVTDRQQSSRPSPSVPVGGFSSPNFNSNNNNAVVRTSTASPSSGGSRGASNPYIASADLSLTAPDRAMLEMLIAEANDRHFVEKLFVAQEEKHERNQWLMIEAHRRRMLQMSYAAPVRIARMETTQEQRVGDLIAEYEVGEEIFAQRKKMDDRVAELRSMIETTNRYRDALEELEADHKSRCEREMADIEDERRAKKRLLDELTRQYEFSSIHNRTDDVYSGQFGIRAGLEFQRTHRRDPDPLKTATVGGPRAVETVTEQPSTTAFAIRNSTPAVATSVSTYREPSRYNNNTMSGNATATNYSTMTNFNATSAAIQRGASASPEYNNSSNNAPAAPLQEPTANNAGVPSTTSSGDTTNIRSNVNDIILQSQRALARAEELERSATAESRRY